MAGLDQVPSKLSFAELARSKSSSADFEALAAQNGYRFDQRLLQCVELFHRLPIETQNWAAERALSQRDLQPLLALENLPLEFLQLLAAARVSRSYGAQIIELLVDNILLGNVNLEPPAPFTADKAAEWIARLKTSRFPETSRRDEEKKSRLSSLPWPKGFLTRWQRQGDQSGLEVRFTVASKIDMQSKIEALQRVLEHFDD